MTASSNDDQSGFPTPKPGLFDQVWWKLHTNTTLLALVLIAFLCVGGAFLYRPLLQPAEESFEFTGDVVGTSLQFTQSAQDDGTYYFAWPENGSASDIYLVTLTATSTAPVNLTNTPNYAEWWPVPSPVDDRLAFLAVSTSGERSLRVMDSNGVTVDATYNAANSDLGSKYQIDLSVPPQWSEDGQWIAFLGQSADEDHPVVQLFVANVDRSEINRLTHGSQTIISPLWSAPARIMYAERYSEHSIELFEVVVSSTPVTPVPLGTLQLEP